GLAPHGTVARDAGPRAAGAGVRAAGAVVAGAAVAGALAARARVGFAAAVDTGLPGVLLGSARRRDRLLVVVAGELRGGEALRQGVVLAVAARRRRLLRVRALAHAIRIVGAMSGLDLRADARARRAAAARVRTTGADDGNQGINRSYARSES